MRPSTDRPLLRNFLIALPLFFAIFAPATHSQPSDSTSLDDAVHQLADRVAAIPNLHGPLRLQFLQDPNFAADTGKDWQETFRKDIENHDLTLTEDPTATLLRVGLAETPMQLVFSASVHVADKDEVRLLTLARTSFRAASLPVAPIRVERQLTYQSPERILDASSLWNGAEGGMALLTYNRGELSALRVDVTGELKQSVPLTVAAVKPARDPRGELIVRGNDAVVHLPGKTCELSWNSSAEPACHSAKPSWRGTTVLTPSCDAGGWKLIADGSDWTAPDVLQVVPDGLSHQGSAALLADFPGPILAVNGEQNPAGALVVTKNLRTGNYEVYKITLACGN